jgi:hypothetical protein
MPIIFCVTLISYIFNMHALGVVVANLVQLACLVTTSNGVACVYYPTIIGVAYVSHQCS